MEANKNIKIKIGRYNTLRVVRAVDFGVYLDGGDKGDILMPKRYVSENIHIGDDVDVFVYLDSEDRLVATTETPLAQVGEFAFLRVKTVTQFGAFLDWGLTKDLLVPYKEQRDRMCVDKSYIVYLYVDENSNRIAASEKINKYLDNIAPKYNQGDEVDILISDKTPMGYKAIINNCHSGLIYNNEMYERLEIGEHRKAYIKQVREDDKIDLSLQRIGYDKVDDLKSTIIKRLKEHNGKMPIGDHTDPETIRFMFGCSKKTFKMTIGTMYREQIISIDSDGITLL